MKSLLLYAFLLLGMIEEILAQPSMSPTTPAPAATSTTPAPVKSTGGATLAPNMPTSGKSLKPTFPSATKMPNKTKKPSRVRTHTPKSSKPSRKALTPFTHIKHCARKVRLFCNCGLLLKGSDCGKLTVKTICRLPRNRRARVFYTIIVVRRAKHWCKKMIRQADGHV